MMKNRLNTCTITLVAAFLLLNNLTPTNGQNMEWIRQFGTEGSDYAWDIHSDASGVYVSGSTYGIFSGQNYSGISDAYVRKYDSDGIKMWTRQFGSEDEELGVSVSVNESGVYLAGSTKGALPDQTRLGGFDDAFIRKYDMNGNQGWTRQFGTEENDRVNGIFAVASGIYVVGYTGGTLPGQTYLGGFADAFIRKYDMNGNEEWTRQFGSVDHDVAMDVSADESSVYVVGTTTGILSDQPRAGNAFIRKYNSDGEEIWTRQYGTNGARANAISINSSGVYVAGVTYEALPGQSFTGMSDIYIRKYDSDGEEIWTRQFGTKDSDWTRSISVNESEVFVTGDTQPDGEDSDILLFRYDNEGTRLWDHQFGTENNDGGTGISVDATGVYLAGYTYGALSEQTSLGQDDAFVIKVDINSPQFSYEVLDIDFCNPSKAPFYNFYWNEMKSVARGSEFFSQNETHSLTFTEFTDGTALIQGATQSGTCSAQLYIVLKDKKNWASWSYHGGRFKPHGCDPGSLKEEDLRYYVIDGNQSTISITGGDCLEEGTFFVTQRPDPNDPTTANLGVHVGPGGALFDSDITAEGLAGWAWMGPKGDQRRWEIDFNFHIEGSENLEHNSEEVCDGIDNNGDGQIDEGLICDEVPNTATADPRATQTVIIPYPTMFNDRLNLQIEIEYSAIAQIQLFDLQWRSVMAKKDINVLPGKNDLSIDVAGLAPNMYILVLNTGREEFKLQVFAQ